MSDYRKRIEDAITKHHAKTAKRKGVKKKNGKPEQLVVKAVMEWGKRVGCDLHIVESKAVYSKAAGRYLHTQTSESLPDIIGNWKDLSLWIEVKAKGRRSTLKPHQKDFLERKIQQGCFAVCVDDVQDLDLIFQKFQVATPGMIREGILLDHLPKKKNTAKSLSF
jgi:hypothetical protein